MKTQIIYTALIALIFCSGCFKDEINLDLNSEENKKLVINGWITDIDEQQYVDLTLTTDYLDSIPPEPVNDALVELSYESEKIQLELFKSGRYILPLGWKGVVGTEYTLTVDYKDEQYTASALLRAMPEAENIRNEFYEDQEDSTSYYDVYFDFQETPGEGDGYFAVDYRKNSFERNVIRNGGWTNDEFTDGLYYEAVTVSTGEYQIGDTIILEVHSIGMKGTEYLERISTEIFREGLLDPPPVNVPTNISNGGLGYFIAAGKKTYEHIITE